MPRRDGPVYVAPAKFFGLSVPSRSAKSGENITIFGAGFGPPTPMVAPGQIVRTPAPMEHLTRLRILVGGVPATVQYAGITNAGEFQLNVQLPMLPDGDQPIVAYIDTVTTPSGIFIPIKNRAGNYE